ncbi:hypothetical protein Cgig2_032336 [Carnegiea gigantea]|uniref:Uncharacterized protein n=1 Tax=Carnegiea gigantea TaxID=171969 RepID=A0A9Q1Q8G7_9CARY|nr:hypothetical protein Cgig2_032336 [Carnegiea gigantea]
MVLMRGLQMDHHCCLCGKDVTVDKDIVASIIYTPTASQICKNLSQRFSFNQGTKIYQLQKEMTNLSQVNLSVSTYFTKCKQLWDEHIVLVEPCACASTGSVVKLIERQQLMQFLMGLNDSYHVVGSNILMLNPLPSVSQASSIQKEIKNTIAPIQMDVDATTFLANQRRQFTLNKPALNLPYFSRANHSGLQPSTYSQPYNVPLDKRIAASVQQPDSGSDFHNVSNQSLGHNTLTVEQYEQVLALLSKQNMEVTTSIPSQHSRFLTGKPFCLLSAQPELSWC